MIVTDLQYVDLQVSTTLALTKAIEFLRLHDILDLPDGKIVIDGERVFAIVQHYETIKTHTPTFECHQKYIDVQYIVSGEEIIGWAPIARMTVTESYDADQDISFGTVTEGEWTPIKLQTGQLALFYPADCHAPKLASGKPSPVMKIVVKVAV